MLRCRILQGGAFGVFTSCVVLALLPLARQLWARCFACRRRSRPRSWSRSASRSNRSRSRSMARKATAGRCQPGAAVSRPRPAPSARSGWSGTGIPANTTARRCPGRCSFIAAMPCTAPWRPTISATRPRMAACGCARITPKSCTRWCASAASITPRSW